MIHFLRQPFNYFFNHLTYRLKFILMISLFLLVSVICLIFIYRAQQHRIQETKLTLQGIEHQKNARKVLEDLLLYQLLLQRIHVTPNDSLRADLVKKQAQLTEDFTQLRKTRDFWISVMQPFSTAADIQTFSSFDPDELFQQWQEVRDQLFVSADEQPAIEIIKRLIAHVSELNFFISQYANLSHDPDLRVDGMLKAATQQIPSLQQTITNLTISLSSEDGQTNVPHENKLNQELLFKELAQKEDQLKLTINRILAQPTALLTSEASANWQEKLSLAWSAHQKILNSFLSRANPAPALPLAATNSSEVLLQGGQLLQSSFLLWDLLTTRIQQVLNERLETLRDQLWGSMTLVTVLSALGLLLALLLAYQILHAIDTALKAIKEFKSGNTAARLPIVFKDEIGQISENFNNLADLNSQVGERLQKTSFNLGETTNQLNSAVKEQQEIASQQETAAGLIAADAAKIRHASKEISKAAETMRGSTSETSILASQGKDNLHEMELVVQKMVEVSGSISDKLSILNEKMRMITTGVNSIAKVADQTNLLSLNAAIEAEKAGEQGRSFSVIAEEIRRLADQTTNAIQDIERTVAEMTTAISIGVEGMQKNKEEIRSGNAQVQESYNVLNKISDRIQGFSTALDLVARSVNQQLGYMESIEESSQSLTNLLEKDAQSIRHFTQQSILLGKTKEEIYQLIGPLAKKNES